MKSKGGIESLGRRRNRGKRESDGECLYYMRSRSNRGNMKRMRTMSRRKMNLSGNIAPKRQKRKTNMRRRKGGEDGGTI